MSKVAREIEEAARIIEEIIRECQPCTSAEVLERYRERRGGNADPRIARRALAKLVREGKVMKEPGPRGMLVFRLSP